MIGSFVVLGWIESCDISSAMLMENIIYTRLFPVCIQPCRTKPSAKCQKLPIWSRSCWLILVPVRWESTVKGDTSEKWSFGPSFFLSSSLLKWGMWHMPMRTHNLSLWNKREAGLQANRESWGKTRVQLHAPSPYLDKSWFWEWRVKWHGQMMGSSFLLNVGIWQGPAPSSRSDLRQKL